jgi:membrane carboxypeptidase/penicillin-binding protein
MKKAAKLKPLKGEGFEPPEGVLKIKIDPTTGLLATDRCLEVREEYFIEGTEPVVQCYGNNYEQAVGSGAPVSIYSTPSNEPSFGADNEDGP